MSVPIPPAGGSFPRRPRPAPQEPRSGAGPSTAHIEGGPDALQAIEAERSVLGSILIDHEALFRIASLLTPDDFYNLAHAHIYAAALSLHRAATALDLVTLGDELDRREQLKSVGGPAYLAGLMNATPTAVHVAHYAQIVRARALARRMVDAAGRLAAAGYEHPNDPDGALEALEAITTAVRASWPVQGPQPATLLEMVPPIDPDAFLVGGFIRPGTTVMLTGPPGSAKSWAARQLAMAAAAGLDSFLSTYAIERPLNVLVIDEDNGPDEEWRRDETLLLHLQVTRPQLEPRLRRVSLAGVQLDTLSWQTWLRDAIERHHIDLVICDPISEMHGGKELREDPAFRSLLGFLKRLKVDFPKLATLLVHHTRKQMAGEKSADRGLDDVRGQWGQTPDVVALMWPLAEKRVAWELHKRVPHSKLILEASEAGPLLFQADDTTSRSRAMVNDGLVIDAIRGGLTSFSEIQEGIAMAKGTLHGVLKRLLGSKTIDKDGQVYRVIEDER